MHIEEMRWPEVICIVPDVSSILGTASYYINKAILLGTRLTILYSSRPQALLESVRLHPVVAMHEFITIRVAQVGPYFVPEGLTVVCNVFSATRDPAVWEDSLAFKPQRFATTGDVEELLRTLWLPFNRSGPGGKGEVAVGLVAAKAVLAGILRSLSPVGPVEEKQHVQELVCRPFKGMEIPFVHA